MKKKIKFKKGDEVLVIAGKDRNKKGVILKVFPQDEKLLISGINLVKKHQKPSAKDQNGGIISIESKIHLSNVSHIDPISKKATRIGFKIVDGKKIRYAKKSQEAI